MTNIKRVGVDIAKTVFHIHAVDGRDKSVWEGKYISTLSKRTNDRINFINIFN